VDFLTRVIQNVMTEKNQLFLRTGRQHSKECVLAALDYCVIASVNVGECQMNCPYNRIHGINY
jgi:hypothetical protein